MPRLFLAQHRELSLVCHGCCSAPAALLTVFLAAQVGVIDAWGARFFAEMDYTWEAANAEALRTGLAHLEGVQVGLSCLCIAAMTPLVTSLRLDQANAPAV